MSNVRISINRDQRLAKQPDKGHNRWHPDIPPIARLGSEASVAEMQTLDALDGQIKPGTTTADLASFELGLVHPLTGPIYIEGAEPGDLLAVKIQSIAPVDHGFTAILPGFGFLRDVFLTPFIVHWKIENGAATSEQLPGVRIPGAPLHGSRHGC